MNSQHPYLIDPEHARVYQLLNDSPRGTSRAWAAEAGWTYARMRTFLDRLQEHGLAKVTRVGNIRVFEAVRDSVKDCDTVRHSATQCEPVSSYPDKQPVKPVTRYGGAPAKQKADQQLNPSHVRLIETFNAAIRQNFPDWQPISTDHIGSNKAAAKYLEEIPVQRAEQLVREAGVIFSPDRNGGELPYSLGHTFVKRYVFNEWRRTQRELEEGQLSMLFVDRGPKELAEPAPRLASIDSPSLNLGNRNDSYDEMPKDWREILAK